jgi:hypothetical protein
MITHVNVSYTAYERGTNIVISEGVHPVAGSNAWTAEQTVKAMFSGLDVVIRGSNFVRD